MKFALVGRGIWGKNYIRTIKKIPGCELPKDYIKTNNYNELFRYKDIDGIIIATPASTHYKIAKDFLERGFNILVEKPLVINFQDALKLKKIADQNKGTVAMVGHIYLFNPAFETFKKYVQKIRKISYIESYGSNYGPFRKDVSPLWDWAPHDISMLTDIFGKPTSITAWETSRTMYYIKLNFRKMPAFIFCGSQSPIKKRSMVAVGNKSAVIFDDTSSRKVLYIKKLSRVPKISYPYYNKEDSLRRQLVAFINCIKAKKKPKTDFNHGTEVVKIIEAAEKSLREGGKTVLF
ncbi:Gfo/Idh/MocA family oxidoreductase [Patescibacteria group bacterium]|nr:Gfo/Idh/MocA family oxidoreductase [Patescibacteria group bacterium]